MKRGREGIVRQRTENKLVVSPSWANASLTFGRVCGGVGTEILEILGVSRWLADQSRRAAELAVAEHRAGVVTPSRISQLHRTRLVHVHHAFARPAARLAARSGAEFYGNVEPLHHRNVDEIIPSEVQDVFGNGIRGSALGFALEEAAAVAAQAFSSALAVESAVGSAPDAARAGEVGESPCFAVV